MYEKDTIAAVATPAGAGGVGIVRLSGPEAKTLLARVFLPLSPGFVNFRPWTLHHGRVLDVGGAMLDDVLAVFMPGPRSFTGEDVAEIHCHGGMSILAALLEHLHALGARQAEAGEFSKRAFLNGRMDLAQAEAVAELINAPGKEAVLLSAAKLDGLLSRRVRELAEKVERLRTLVCAAVDFPEEETDCLAREDFLAALEAPARAARELLAARERCRRWHEGALIVLAGRVNVGKSSLMNALLGRRRALVTDAPGTTRDFLEERLLLDGLPARLVDTAGLRQSADPAEKLGMAAARGCMEEADLVLLVLDGGQGRTEEDAELFAGFAADRVLPVWNKCDLARPAADGVDLARGGEAPRLVAPLVVSAVTGEGLDELAAAARRAVLAGSGGQTRAEAGADEMSLNLRQARALRHALEELDACAAAVDALMPYDVCTLHLDGAVAALGEILGLGGAEEILRRVFAEFCIGK